MSEAIEDTRVGLIGKTIGRYRVTAELGRGGMATVYRAHDPQLGRDVAIKVMHGAFAGRAELEARFRREARAVAAIKHDGIVNVFDFATAGAGEPGYIVTEIVEGPTLRTVMDRHGGRLWPEVGALVALRLAGALGAAHARGIVHRDVKPDNVMFDLASPATARVLLTDFGIAHMTEAETMTATGAIVGSPIYMSPEQARGQEIGPASDVFSLGVLLYHVTTGRPPFGGRDPLTAIASILRGEFLRPSQVDAHVGPALEAVILRCMRTAPAERFPDGNALATALAEITGDVEKMLACHDGDAGAALRRFFDEEREVAGGDGNGAASAGAAGITSATTVVAGATVARGTARGRGPSFAVTLAPRVAEQAFEQARRHVRRRELARALAETNRVFAYVPDHAGARALLAGIARRRRTGRVAAAGLLGVALVGGGFGVMRHRRAAHSEARDVAAEAPPRAGSATPTAGAGATNATVVTAAAAGVAVAAMATAEAATPTAAGAGIPKHKLAAHAHPSGKPPAAAKAAAAGGEQPPVIAPTGVTPAATQVAPVAAAAAATASAPMAPAVAAPAAAPSIPTASVVLRASQGFCSPSMDELRPSIPASYERVAAGIHRIYCTLPGNPKTFVADYDLRPGGRANLVIVPGSDGQPILSRPD